MAILFRISRPPAIEEYGQNCTFPILRCIARCTSILHKPAEDLVARWPFDSAAVESIRTIAMETTRSQTLRAKEIAEEELEEVTKSLEFAKKQIGFLERQNSLTCCEMWKARSRVELNSILGRTMFRV